MKRILITLALVFALFAPAHAQVLESMIKDGTILARVGANETVTGVWLFTNNFACPLIYGSSAANGDITIEGTSHGTKDTSYVILQPTTGNVGIGTTTPAQKLQISGGNILLDNNASLMFKDSGGTSRRIGSLAADNSLHIGHMDSGWANNDLYLYSARHMYFYVNDGGTVGLTLSNTGTATATAFAGNSLTAPTLYGSTAANGDLTLEGTSSGTKDTSYVILQPTGGNVGIGTATPGAKLHVGGDILLDNNANLRFKDSGGTSRRIGSLAADNSLHIGHMDSGWANNDLYLYSARHMYFYVNDGGTVGLTVSNTGALTVPAAATFQTSVTTPAIKITTGAADGYYLRSDADGDATWTAVSAAQVYKGTWLASSNTPTLADGTGTAGWYYRAVDAGTVNFGHGNITFAIGDDVSYDGALWQKIPGQGYTLQAATASVLGGVKVGGSLQINSEVLNVNNADMGDVTVSGSGADTGKVWTIDAGAVSYAKMQDVSATNRLLGRATAGAGDPEEITVGGDISQSGSTFTIGAGAVTYAKIQDVSATDKLLGRATAGAGDVEEIPLTAAGRALLDDAAAADQRTTLGLGNSATLSVGTTAGTVAAGDDGRFVTGGNTHDHAGGDGAQIAYSGLSGIPASFTPAAHVLNSASHTVSGLTTGHFLKATGAATFGFAAHGLTYSDVGAAPTAQGVTNGDTHDHSGGDGAQVAYGGLSGIPATFVPTSHAVNAATYGYGTATDAGHLRVGTGLSVATGTVSVDAELAAIAGLVSAADQVPYFTGSGTAALSTLTSFGRSLINDADAATARTTLQLSSYYVPLAGTSSIAGNLTPGTDSTYDLGSSIAAWDDTYSDVVHTSSLAAQALGGSIYIDPAVAGFKPDSDGEIVLGDASHRWELVRGVTITPGDIVFENGWKLREYPATAEDVGKPEEWMRKHANLGLQILDENENLIAVFHKDGTLYVDNIKPLSALLGKAASGSGKQVQVGPASQ